MPDQHDGAVAAPGGGTALPPADPAHVLRDVQQAVTADPDRYDDGVDPDAGDLEATRGEGGGAPWT
jgi:hypothetical protein